MTEWVQAVRRHTCGRCGKTIEAGEPLVLHKLPGVKRRLRRCAECEGTPVPTELQLETDGSQ